MTSEQLINEIGKSMLQIKCLTECITAFVLCTDLTLTSIHCDLTVKDQNESGVLRVTSLIKKTKVI